MQDPISDFLTRIRNASRAGNPECSAQHSKMKWAIGQILHAEGFIHGLEERTTERGHREIVVKLKYVDGSPAITGIKNVSKPGCRIYRKTNSIPRVLGGLGIGILTTSKGLMRDREARRQKIGGELICVVW